MIWRFSDGRRGHDSQGLGLCLALERLTPCFRHEFAALSPLRCIEVLATGRFPPGAGLPAPDVLVGAGRGSHLSLWAARRAAGGFSVVLMRPSLPRQCFDLCLIPEHDAPVAAGNIVATKGPLTPLRPAAKTPGKTLVLLGGPSRHFHWEEARILEQVRAVAAACAGPCLLTDSPRTPAPTRAALMRAARDNLRFFPWEEQDPQWLHAELASVQEAWVSADSITMIYEALSAGAAVGLLEPAPRRGSRVAAAVARLRAEQAVTGFGDWRAGEPLRLPVAVPYEAGRCAALIVERLRGRG